MRNENQLLCFGTWRSDTKNRDSKMWTFLNLFFPDKNSKIQSFRKLTKEAIKTLLNKIFRLDQEQKKNIIQNYMNEKNIMLTWLTVTDLSRSTILLYLKLLVLDKFILGNEKNDLTDEVETVFG